MQTSYLLNGKHMHLKIKLQQIEATDGKINICRIFSVQKQIIFTMKKTYKIICFIVALIIIFNIKPVVPQSVHDRPISDFYYSLKRSYAKPCKAIRLFSYNILSDNILYGGSPVALREKEMCALLSALSPDVAALQEVSETWFDVLKNNDSLRFVDCFYNLSKPMTLTLYNKNTLTLIKSGSKPYQLNHNPRLRRIDWAVFTQKSSQRIFATVNTHLSVFNDSTTENMNQADELISFCRILEEKYCCPVFILGDFNSFDRKTNNDKKCDVYDYISLYAENVKITAKTLTTGNIIDVYSPKLDHIFVKGKCETLSFNLLCYNEISHLSDHYPIFADVILKE